MINTCVYFVSMEFMTNLLMCALTALNYDYSPSHHPNAIQNISIIFGPMQEQNPDLIFFENVVPRTK